MHKNANLLMYSNKTLLRLLVKSFYHLILEYHWDWTWQQCNIYWTIFCNITGIYKVLSNDSLHVQTERAVSAPVFFMACLFFVSDIKLRSDKYFLLIATTFFSAPEVFIISKPKKLLYGKPCLGYDNSRITITGLMGIGRNIDKLISFNSKWFRVPTEFKYLHNWPLKLKKKNFLDVGGIGALIIKTKPRIQINVFWY